MNALPRYLNGREVAAMLGCSYGAALKVMRDAGAVKLGALVRVREDVLQAHLDRCPDPASQREYFGAQIDPVYTRISHATSRTSPSGPTTKSKPRRSSRGSCTLEDYEKLRLEIAQRRKSSRST